MSSVAFCLPPCSSPSLARHVPREESSVFQPSIERREAIAADADTLISFFHFSSPFIRFQHADAAATLFQIRRKTPACPPSLAEVFADIILN